MDQIMDTIRNKVAVPRTTHQAPSTTHQAPSTTHQAPSTTHRTSGFTLIELLAVLAIMAILMGISLVAFKDFGRGASMRAGVLEFKSGFSLARQYAITKRSKTTVEFGNLAALPPRAYFFLSTEEEGQLGETNLLSEGILFDEAEFMGPVVFKIDGGCEGSAAVRTMALLEQGQGKVGTRTEVLLYPLTGRVKVKQEDTI